MAIKSVFLYVPDKKKKGSVLVYYFHRICYKLQTKTLSFYAIKMICTVTEMNYVFINVLLCMAYNVMSSKSTKRNMRKKPSQFYRSTFHKKSLSSTEVHRLLLTHWIFA